jgi:hypothetical protein
MSCPSWGSPIGDWSPILLRTREACCEKSGSAVARRSGLRSPTRCAAGGSDVSGGLHRSDMWLNGRRRRSNDRDT